MRAHEPAVSERLEGRNVILDATKQSANIDFNVLLIGVMTIADEVDSQLRQPITSFCAGSPSESTA